MSELPNGWAYLTISSLGGTVGGKTPSKSVAGYWSNGDIPWTSPKDMKSFRLTDSEDKISSQAIDEGGMRLLPKNSVLVVTRSGILAHTLPVALTEIETTINQDIKAIFPTALVEPRLLAYALRAFGQDILSTCSKDGTTVASVETSKLEKYPLPIPSLNEQKRIADKLDRLLARVDAAKARLDKIPALLKRLRQAILAAATSGRLTEEWRLSSNITENEWPTASLESVCIPKRVITYGVIKLGKEISDGVPCLRTSNVRWLNVDTEGIKRIAPGLSKDYSRTILQGAEVLVNVRGTLGGVAVVTPEMIGWNVSREVAVVPVDTNILNPYFLAYLIGSDSSQRWLTGVQKGVAYVGINIEDLRTLPVALPAMEEQTEITRRVEELFAIADRIEAQYRTARARVDRLTQSLLAKAFRGELVPQDPNDEPATALLERIRAQRAAAPKPKRGRYRKAAIQELPMVAEAQGSYTRKMSRRSQSGKKSK